MSNPNHFPAGTAGGKGGQFAPSRASTTALTPSPRTPARLVTPGEQQEARRHYDSLSKAALEGATQRQSELLADLQHGIAYLDREISKKSGWLEDEADHVERELLKAEIRKLERRRVALELEHDRTSKATEHVALDEGKFREALQKHFDERGLGETHRRFNRDWVNDASDDHSQQMFRALAEAGIGSHEGASASPEMRRYARELYALHQAYLERAGIREVHLFRGIRGQLPATTKAGDEIELNTRPAASWSTSPQSAHRFAVQRSYAPTHGTLQVTVPASHILTSRLFLGDHPVDTNENEWVVLAPPTGNRKATVYGKAEESDFGGYGDRRRR